MRPRPKRAVSKSVRIDPTRRRISYGAKPPPSGKVAEPRQTGAEPVRAPYDEEEMAELRAGWGFVE